MAVVRAFVWFVILALGTAVVLLFAAPYLPTLPIREAAERQRGNTAVGAATILVVTVVVLVLLRSRWTSELGALASSRVGLLALSVVVAASCWSTMGLLLWNALYILPRHQENAAALIFLGIWLLAVAIVTARWCWLSFRNRALDPVLAAPLTSGRLGAATGMVELVPGVQPLIDPVTLGPCVAWVLDTEATTVWAQRTVVADDPGNVEHGKIEETTTETHRRSAAEARLSTRFYIQSPKARVYIPQPGVRFVPPAKVIWEQGEPPFPPFPAEMYEDLRRRGLLDMRFGSRSIAPGDVVSVTGLVKIDDDGNVHIEATRSILPKFWKSPLHGVKCTVTPASASAKRALRSVETPLAAGPSVAAWKLPAAT